MTASQQHQDDDTLRLYSLSIIKIGHEVQRAELDLRRLMAHCFLHDNLLDHFDREGLSCEDYAQLTTQFLAVPSSSDTMRSENKNHWIDDARCLQIEAEKANRDVTTVIAELHSDDEEDDEEEEVVEDGGTESEFSTDADEWHECTSDSTSEGDFDGAVAQWTARDLYLERQGTLLVLLPKPSGDKREKRPNDGGKNSSLGGQGILEATWTNVVGC